MIKLPPKLVQFRENLVPDTRGNDPSAVQFRKGFDACAAHLLPENECLRMLLKYSNGEIKNLLGLLESYEYAFSEMDQARICIEAVDAALGGPSEQD